jgi:hypothetical protein
MAMFPFVVRLAQLLYVVTLAGLQELFSYQFEIPIPSVDDNPFLIVNVERLKTVVEFRFIGHFNGD